MSHELRNIVKEAQHACVSLLEQALPAIGGDDWWNKTVKWRLSVPQERMLEERGITELRGLDLAALLRVLEKNWYDISNRLRFPREGRTLVNEVRNIRNRLAHEALDDIPAQDRYRDADTLCRFLKLLQADSASVSRADKLRDALLQGMTSSARETATSDAAVDPDDPFNTFETELEPDPTEIALASEPAGIPVTSLQPGAGQRLLADTASRATFVGIDFGTSTTVVSMAVYDRASGGLRSEPVPLRQRRASGVEVDDHLVPTCIGWKDGQLLIGHGAAEIRPELVEGRNLWSSFKMRLGIDLGPQYPYTELRAGSGAFCIERPQDAARIFFSYLREEIENHVQRSGLPSRIFYSVSVPAGFEANQRQDLVNALADAGIDIEESSLIDEPNAAFLSYLIEMQLGSASTAFLGGLAKRERKVLVFDFGAGTCDISVLEIGLASDRLSSRNLAISRFMALGGDDIDRAIAREVLLPQLCGGRQPADCFTVNELDTHVLPCLKAEAEQLKIACSKLARSAGFSTPDELRQSTRPPLSGNPVPPFKLRNQQWNLTEPTISLAEFANVMEPFLRNVPPGKHTTADTVPGVLAPVQNALDKAGLKEDGLNMVLFIGGSSENPLVTQCVEDYFGRFVDCVSPRDLRAHVSQGAAINSLFVHGLGWELIQPITSEPVFVVTRDGGLEQVVAAGTPVPSTESAPTVLRIREDGQPKVELPFCVGGRDKVLAVISVDPPKPPGCFNSGDQITVSCSITREKLLKARIRVGDRTTTAKILNPLANAELTPNDRKLMEARQALNESILEGGGRPSVPALLNYAIAASNAGRWREAAEIYEAIERLDSKRDFATNIAYNYAMAGMYDRSDEWSAHAYQRDPDSVTAYNLALGRERAGDTAGYEKLMDEALQHDSDYTAALSVYGHYLSGKGRTKGMQMIERACELLASELGNGDISRGDGARLAKCAKTLGRTDVLQQLREHQRRHGESGTLFEEGLLAESSSRTELLEGE